MIDILHAKKEFKNYVSNYNAEEPKIALKIAHIERVAEMSKKIAESLKLSEEEIKLAELIGIFHDIGRFEQVRIANTFNDRESKINHAEKSVQVLFENNFIRNFIKENDYDEIIKKAVLNHNKLKIDEQVKEKELLFSQIIRDADKLDILAYVFLHEDFKAAFWYQDFDVEKINELAFEDFRNGRLLHYKHVKSSADQTLVVFAYIYDLYFDYSLNLLWKDKILEKFADRVKIEFSSKYLHKQIDEILDICEKFFEKKNIK